MNFMVSSKGELFAKWVIKIKMSLISEKIKGFNKNHE